MKGLRGVGSSYNIHDLLLKRNDIESQIEAYSNRKTTGNKDKGKQANSASDLAMDEATIKAEEESFLERFSGANSPIDVNPSVLKLEADGGLRSLRLRFTHHTWLDSHQFNTAWTELHEVSKGFGERNTPTATVTYF